MGGASSYLAILAIAGFLSLSWIATKISKAAGVSSIVLEIATGVVLGPAGVGLVAEEYASCQYERRVNCDAPPDFKKKIAGKQPIGAGLGDVRRSKVCDDYADTHASHGNDHGSTAEDKPDVDANPAIPGDNATKHPEPESHGVTTTTVPLYLPHGRRLAGGGDYDSYEDCLVKTCKANVAHDCQETPNFFTLVGHTGVAMMIFESGMHFDFEKARIVGPKACVVAVFGTLLPLITGCLVTMAFGKPFFPDGITVGTALAPTSVGIALRLLGEARVLQEDFGQAIITAAFVDDILSLILFNVLFSLRGEFDIVSVVVFPIIGVAFMGIAMVGAVKFWPKAINEWILPRVPDNPNDKVPKKDQALFLIMMLLFVAYATITHFLGTHLWGCFIAGMSFACIDKNGHGHHVWVKQTKRVTSWMIRVFFSATVAFSIPVASLLSFDAFWKGSIMGIGPCVLTKVLCAPIMGSAKFVIGWAMVGRAEFAYLIAQMGAAAGMMDQDTFSIVIWALLYATIFAPIVFRKVLDRYVKEHCQDVVAKISETSEGDQHDLKASEH